MLDEVGWKVRIMVMLVMLVLVLNAAVDIAVVTNQQLRYSVAWDWEKDMLDRLGRKVRMMVMLVMLVLVLNAAVDIAVVTNQYSSGTALREHYVLRGGGSEKCCNLQKPLHTSGPLGGVMICSTLRSLSNVRLLSRYASMHFH